MQPTPGIGSRVMSPLSESLGGRRALVTGGTKGVGAAIAERLGQAGATVLVTARSKPDGLDPKLFVGADLSTPKGPRGRRRVLGRRRRRHPGAQSRRVRRAVRRLRRAERGPLGQELNTNLLAAVRLDRGLLPSMIEAGTRGDRARLLDPAPHAAVERHPCLRRRQGRADDLQQGPGQPGRPARRARQHRRPGSSRPTAADDLVDRIARAPASPRSGAGAADGLARRHPPRPPQPAGGSRRIGRLPRLRPRRRHRRRRARIDGGTTPAV